MYGCYLTHMANIEGATRGVVRAFWLPNGASVRRLIRRAPLRALPTTRLFHSRTKSASLDSHMYVSGWLLCCHEPKYPQVSVHQALSGPNQDDIFCQDLIHCSGR